MSDQGRQFFRSVFSKFHIQKSGNSKGLDNGQTDIQNSDRKDAPLSVDSSLKQARQRFVNARRKDRDDSYTSKIDSNDSNHQPQGGQPAMKNLILDQLGEIEKQNMTKKQLHD